MAASTLPSSPHQDRISLLTLEALQVLSFPLANTTSAAWNATALAPISKIFAMVSMLSLGGGSVEQAAHYLSLSFVIATVMVSSYVGYLRSSDQPVSKVPLTVSFCIRRDKTLIGAL